ncbi:F-box/WD repeat-containing protein 7-like isoform X2 [Watersipora subatra]
MLCCGNIRISSPNFLSSTKRRFSGASKHSSSSSLSSAGTSLCSQSATSSPLVLSSVGSSGPALVVSSHTSPSHRVTAGLTVDTSLISSETSQQSHLTSRGDIISARSSASSISSCEETTPRKLSLNCLSRQFQSPSDNDLSASSEHLCHKRKSDLERELSSPGKRVRGMSDSNASLLLHMQSFQSPTSYGHIPVSPQTPSKRRSSCKGRVPKNLEMWLQMFMSWDGAEKTQALNQLIDSCDAPHVRHIMAIIEPQFQRDFISLLPKELALYVLSFLTPKDLLRAGQTCQYWRMLTEDTLLWRAKCKESGADLGLMYKTLPLLQSSSSASSNMTTNDAAPVMFDDTETDENIDWKSIYLRAHTIEHHWRCGEVKPPKILRGHDDHVITCLEFSGNRIVSGSDDNTLKVWDVETAQCLRTLVGHTGGVWSSQMRDNIVISGSTDRTLRVWDTETGECMHTLHGHTSTVRCMHLHKNIVVSGSRDATLRMWDISNGECVHVLIGHVAAVRCVQYDGKKVVSGAYDYTVRVWDPITQACIHILQGHTNRVYSLQFDGKHIVSGSLDTSIRVWDVDSGTCLHTLTGHQSLTSGMEIQDGLLVSGNADSTVKVWDINTGTCLQTLTGTHKHQGAVTCLQFTRKFVVTSSDDGTVKLWSLQTGEFIRNLVSLESSGSGGVVWRVKADNTLLVCASGSRNGTEDTKLIVLDFGLKESQQELLADGQLSASHYRLDLDSHS